MPRRARNPTRKRLEWVAKNSSNWVLLRVIGAWAEAMGLHDLKRRADQLRHMQFEGTKFVNDDRSTKEIALASVAAATEQAQLGEDTRYDRYLPWAAAALKAQEKAAVRRWKDLGRQYERRYSRAEMGPETADAVASLRKLKRLDQVRLATMQALPTDEWREIWHEAQDGAARLATFFRIITDWAQAEGVDLGGYSIDDAIWEAREWGRRREAELRAGCTPMPKSTVVYEWPDGWTVVDLRSQRELYCEGQVMRHCVDEYEEADLVAQGGSIQLFSLRDPEGRPRLTMEFASEQNLVPESGFRAFANAFPDVVSTSRMLEFRLACGPMIPHAWRSVSAPSEIRSMEDWEGRFEQRGSDGKVLKTVDVFSGQAYNTEDVAHALEEERARLWDHFERVYEDWGVEERYEKDEAEGEDDDDEDDWIVESRGNQIRESVDHDLLKFHPAGSGADESKLYDEDLGPLQLELFLKAGLANELDLADDDEMIEALEFYRRKGGYLLAGVPPFGRMGPMGPLRRLRALPDLQRGEAMVWVPATQMWDRVVLHPPGRVTERCLAAS